jgi:hypothetical protein
MIRTVILLLSLVLSTVTHAVDYPIGVIRVPRVVNEGI